MQPLAALVAVVVLFLLPAPATSRPVGRSVFRETEVTHSHVVRQVETWRSRVLTRNDKVIGYAVVVCFLTSRVDTLRQCSGTYVLPEGRISVSGAVICRCAFQLTILGGTERYIGARGAMTSVMTGTEPRTARIVFRFQ